MKSGRKERRKVGGKRDEMKVRRRGNRDEKRGR